MFANFFQVLTKNEKLVVLVFFIVVSFIYLGANIFVGEIVAPMDLLLQYPGYYESGYYVPSFNNERSDIIDGQMPTLLYVRNQLMEGDLPLWDNLHNGGIPIPTISYFFNVGYLPFLISGDGIGFTVGLASKLIVGGFGTYLLCRTQFRIIPAVFAGITFMMMGISASMLMSNFVSTLVLLPWILWAIKKTMEKPTMKYASITALLVALAIFGGFPYITVISFYVGLLVVLWIAFLHYKTKKNFRKGLVLVAIGGILGISFTSVYIFWLVDYSENVDTSWRIGHSALRSDDLSILVDPFTYTISYGERQVPQYEKSGYVGLIAVFMSVVGIVGHKRKLEWLSPIFWGPLTILFLIISFSISPFSTFLYDIFPFDKSANQRSLAFVGFGIAILSAYGMERIQDGINWIGDKKRKVAKYVQLSGIVILVSLVGIQALDLSEVSRNSNAIVPSETFYPKTPTLSYVQDNIKPTQQVLATSAYLVSGTVSAYGIPEWFAHGYFSDSEKNTLRKLVTNPWPNNKTASLFRFTQVNFDSEYHDALFVKYVLAAKNRVHPNLYSDPELSPLYPNWIPRQIGTEIILFENSDAPVSGYVVPKELGHDQFLRSKIITENIDLIQYNSGHIKYDLHLNEGGLFVIPLRHWPGWTASVNGETVQVIEYLNILSGIEVDKGFSKVELKYEPKWLTHAFYLTLASFAVLSFLFFYEYRRK